MKRSQMQRCAASCDGQDCKAERYTTFWFLVPDPYPVFEKLKTGISFFCGSPGPGQSLVETATFY